MKIYGFYFIALLNDWKSILDSQIKSLLESELFKNTNKLFVRIFYEKKEDLNYILNILSKLKKIVITITEKNEFEFGTLEKIKEMSKYETFYCYYLHSKGVSINEKNKTFYKNSTDLIHLLKCVESWRKYMEYFIIDEFETCIKTLDDGYDACGVNLTESPSKHFSGNFWWAKSEFIKTLPEIKSLNITNRWMAERWIGLSNAKLKSLFQCSQSGYRQIITTNYKN